MLVSCCRFLILINMEILIMEALPESNCFFKTIQKDETVIFTIIYLIFGMSDNVEKVRETGIYLYIWSVQVKLQIKAFILLGLFSLILLHQMIPHIHQEHQVAHDHGSQEHTHSQDHHHEKQSKNSQGLFSILLTTHSHGGSNSEVPVVKISIEHITPKKVKAENSILQIFLHQPALSEDQVVDFIKNYQPPSKYFNPYLSHLSLRGPPQLV